MPSSLVFNATILGRTLRRMAHEIAERNEQPGQVVVLGIQRGGVHLAKRLAEALGEIWGAEATWGELDVSMHRDDIDKTIAPSVYPTRIPCDVNGRTVVLVDDVLFSGRTTRAAMDALNHFGRPAGIQLAVLIDRGHRELPIKADFVGRNVATSRSERVNVRLVEDGGDDGVYLERH